MEVSVSKVPVYENVHKWEIDGMLYFPRNEPRPVSQKIATYRNGEQWDNVFWQLHLCAGSIDGFYDAPEWNPNNKARLELVLVTDGDDRYLRAACSKGVYVHVTYWIECMGGTESGKCTRKYHEHRRGMATSDVNSNKELAYFFSLCQHPMMITCKLQHGDLWANVITPEHCGWTAACDKLEKNLFNMYTNQELTDATISLDGGQEIKAHKLVLAANSEVLHRMFATDCTETKTNIIQIKDVCSEVCSIMVRYMYGKQQLPSNLSMDILGKVLYAADKYQVLGLKTRCELFMCTKIDQDNVVSALAISDRHGADRLKKYCDQYINLNKKSLVNTEIWRDAIIQYPDLLSKYDKGSV